MNSKVHLKDRMQFVVIGNPHPVSCRPPCAPELYIHLIIVEGGALVDLAAAEHWLKNFRLHLNTDKTQDQFSQ